MDKTKIYERYVRVLTLCEQGVQGEQDNALRMKNKMEQQNPWLYLHHQEQSRVQQSQPQRQMFDWDTVFSAADQIFNTFKDFSEKTYGMQRARLLADQCVLHLQPMPDGSQQMVVVIPAEVRNLLQTVVSEPQKDAFMETMMNRVYSVIAEDVY